MPTGPAGKAMALLALGSLLSAAEADNAQFQLVSEGSKWNGGQYQSTGSKQDNHLPAGAALQHTADFLLELYSSV